MRTPFFWDRRPHQSKMCSRPFDSSLTSRSLKMTVLFSFETLRTIYAASYPRTTEVVLSLNRRDNMKTRKACSLHSKPILSVGCQQQQTHRIVPTWHAFCRPKVETNISTSVWPFLHLWAEARTNFSSISVCHVVVRSNGPNWGDASPPFNPLALELDI